MIFPLKSVNYTMTSCGEHLVTSSIKKRGLVVISKPPKSQDDKNESI